MSTVKQKSKAYVNVGLKPVAHLLKTWYLSVGYDYINSHNLNQTEEDILENITEFYISKIKELEGEN